MNKAQGTDTLYIIIVEYHVEIIAHFFQRVLYSSTIPSNLQ